MNQLIEFGLDVHAYGLCDGVVIYVNLRIIDAHLIIVFRSIESILRIVGTVRIFNCIGEVRLYRLNGNVSKVSYAIATGISARDSRVA